MSDQGRSTQPAFAKSVAVDESIAFATGKFRDSELVVSKRRVSITKTQ